MSESALAPERTFIDYLVEDPMTKAVQVQMMLGGLSGRNATVAELRAKMNADQSDFGRAFRTWFAEVGLEQGLDAIDAEMRALYATSGSELDFDVWAEGANRQMAEMGQRVEIDPDYRAEVVEAIDGLTAELGREPNQEEIVLATTDRVLGPEYNGLIKVGLNWAHSFSACLSEAIADAAILEVSRRKERPLVTELDRPVPEQLEPETARIPDQSPAEPAIFH